MGARLRTIAAQRPGRALGALAAVAVLGAALAAGWTDRLTLSTTGSKGPTLQIQVRGAIPASSPAYRVAVQTMRSQLSTVPAVARVRERRVKGNPDSSLLMVSFQVSGHARDAAISGIEHGLDPGPLKLAYLGPSAQVSAAKDDALGDLYLLLLVLPLVALIAAAVLGVRPAGAALLAAGAASALAALACELLGGPFDVSWLALVGAAAGGILISLQLATLARAGAGDEAIWASALAAAACLGVLAICGVEYLSWLGCGGALGAIFAAPAALTAAGAADGIEPEPRGGPVARLWAGIGGLVGWNPATAVVFGVLALVLLAIVALPAGRVALAAIGAVRVPAIDGARLAIAIAAAAIATAAAGFAVCRRLSLSAPAALLAGVPAVAVAGLLAVTFQEGRLEGLLGYKSSGALQLGSVAAAVAIVAAIGAAQVVAIAWAAREASGDAESRVGDAMARCGPAATVSCLSGVVAGIALGFASRGFIKEFGLGLAVGLALELLIFELLLAPGMLRLTATGAARQ